MKLVHTRAGHVPIFLMPIGLHFCISAHICAEIPAHIRQYIVLEQFGATAWPALVHSMHSMHCIRTPSSRRMATGTARFPCFSSTLKSNFISSTLGSYFTTRGTSLAALTSLRRRLPFCSFLSIRLSPSCESKLSTLPNISPLKVVFSHFSFQFWLKKH